MDRVDKQMTHIAYAIVAFSTGAMSIIEVASQRRIDIVVMQIFIVLSGVLLGHALFGNRNNAQMKGKKIQWCIEIPDNRTRVG